MDHDDRPCALGDRGLDRALVDVERVGSDVDEDRHGAAKDEGVGGRDERERGHDHLVAGSEPAQVADHLQRGGARRGRAGRHAARHSRFAERLGDRTGPLPESVPVRERLVDVPVLIAGAKGRLKGICVERNATGYPAAVAGHPTVPWLSASDAPMLPRPGIGRTLLARLCPVLNGLGATLRAGAGR